MADEESELERDLKEKERLRLAGLATPLNSPSNSPPSELDKDLAEKSAQHTPSKPIHAQVGDEPPSERQQRAQHEQERKAKVQAAIEARRPGAPKPPPKEAQKSPEQQARMEHEQERKAKIEAALAARRPKVPLSVDQQIQQLHADAETQRAVDAARRAGASINYNAPLAVSPTGNGGGGELSRLRDIVEKLRSQVEILFRRPRTTSDGGGGGTTSSTPWQWFNVVKDGGIAGGDGSNCNFTYTVKLWGTSTVIATGVPLTGYGNGWRAIPTELRAATYGQGRLDGSLPTLLLVDEAPANFFTCVEA